MPCGPWVLTGLSDQAADAAVTMANSEVPPPLNVTKAPDSHGTYTVTAIFPPCADHDALPAAGWQGA